MNVWLITVLALLAGMALCGAACLRREVMDSFIALELAGAVAVLVLLVMAALFDSGLYFAPALALLVMSIAGTLAFTRFFERWL